MCRSLEELNGAQQFRSCLGSCGPKILTWGVMEVQKFEDRQPDRQKIMPMAPFMKFVIQ